MILNKRFPQIIQGNISYNTISRYAEIVDFNTEIPYWYIEVGDIHSLTYSIIDSVIPDTIIKLLQIDKIKLAIVNAFEGMHNIVPTIYENLVIGKKIPEDNILLFSESFSIGIAISNCAEKYNLKPIKSFLPMIAEYTTALHWKNNISDNTVDEKRFICLNRRWRPHRPTLVALLYAKGILNDGYVSLISTDTENWDRTLDWIISLNNNQTVSDLLCNNRESILSLPNLTVDLDNVEDYNNIWGFRDYTNPFYQSTSFSVVTETYFYEKENGICITEKTFRPMCYHQPFIVLARPGHLDAIRSLGYKTFNDIFDESYDKEENDANRMLMVVNEIEKLCKMPIDQFRDKMNQCKDICEHNYKLLLSSLSKPKLKLDK